MIPFVFITKNEEKISNSIAFYILKKKIERKIKSLNFIDDILMTILKMIFHIWLKWCIHGGLMGKDNITRVIQSLLGWMNEWRTTHEEVND